MLYVGDRLRSSVEGPGAALSQRALSSMPCATYTLVSQRTSKPAKPLFGSLRLTQKAAKPDFRLVNYRATCFRLRLAYRTTIPRSATTLVRSDYLHGL